MAFFNWNDSYAVGIKEIDTQHQKLVSLLNQLFDAMQQGKAASVLGSVLAQLVQYTKEHFATEERLFARHGYPEAVIHKKEHDALTAKAVALQKDVAAGKVTISLEVSRFLKDWLSNHIMGVDKRYAPFLIAKGVK